MKRWLPLLICMLAAQTASAQKVDSIYFHLYTDSLKKGFYNYINVDGKLSDGSWRPLDSNDLLFTCNTGTFRGNDLLIDSSYTAETVLVKAVLKKNPAVWREAVIYIRKRGFEEPLKKDNEIWNEPAKGRKDRKSGSRN